MFLSSKDSDWGDEKGKEGRILNIDGGLNGFLSLSGGRAGTLHPLRPSYKSQAKM